MQWRRAGDTGWRCISGRFGCPEWWAGALFALALRAGVLGPVTALLGLDPVRTLDASVVQVVGMFCAITGVLGTIVTRLAMSTSWRIGVDETERTELVTNGPFALVRNPGARCATMVSARDIALDIMRAGDRPEMSRISFESVTSSSRPTTWCTGLERLSTITPSNQAPGATQ